MLHNTQVVRSYSLHKSKNLFVPNSFTLLVMEKDFFLFYCILSSGRYFMFSGSRTVSVKAVFLQEHQETRLRDQDLRSLMNIQIYNAETYLPAITI
jgi:hypothetical protein